MNGDHIASNERDGDDRSFTVAAPQVTLPKGGGAIRGIGEKFAANPVTGTGSMTVPIATSPGRSGFGPQLSLTYDSGSGNGPFGFGWSLSIPAISRKTDKGLPLYQDCDESDVFVLSGAEDLVPVYRQDPEGTWIGANPGHRRDADGFWVRDGSGHFVVHEEDVGGYRVRRYRPRIEGLFARIERWSRIGVPDDVHWRSISQDNVLTIYGLDANSRVADPLDGRRIFSWLLCETRDDKGNAAQYQYKAEDGVGVELDRVHERNRGPRSDGRRAANRYLKRIHYGNRTPLLDDEGHRPRFLDRNEVDAKIADAGWMFEVVLDYGDHDPATPAPDDDEKRDAAGQLRHSWNVRPDPFSSYRSRFEVRTTRRCRRVLMFHHFPGATGVGRDCLVRSTDLGYSDDVDPTGSQNAVYTFLCKVTQVGYRRNGSGYESRSLPPVEFDYTESRVSDTVDDVDPASLENLPAGLDGGTFRWTDLHGEGIPGILTEQAGAWYYKRNLSPNPQVLQDGRERVQARFAPLVTVALKPNVGLGAGAELMDLAGDGQPDLVMLDGATPGLYEHDGDEGWQPFRPFAHQLVRDVRDPNLRLVDLDGDGRADVLITEDDAIVWHPSLGEDGFDRSLRISHSLDEEHGPRVLLADGTQSIYLADLSGDGLSDLVRIRNGDVCYWPNLGYGHLGAKITMDNAPVFDHPDQFDQARIRLADIDGSGTTDIVYLHREGVHLYFNQSGNSWSRSNRLNVAPAVDDLANVLAVDLLGNGTACLVWSSPSPADAPWPMRYVKLMGDTKPHLLCSTSNNLGAETRVEYAPSTKFFVRDRQDGKPWITRLPFPVHVVEKVTIYDHVSRNRFVTRFAYHHGYFDGVEREFRGFGLVEQWDTEELSLVGGALSAANVAIESHVPPVHTKTWFHTGAYIDGDHVSDYFAGLLNADDRGEYFREPGLTDDEARALLLPDSVLPVGLTVDEEREACRALKGSMLRQEMYADDAGPTATTEQIERAQTPYTVFEQSFAVRAVQSRGGNRHSVHFAFQQEALTYHYERNPADPRIQHALTLEVDEFGNVLKQTAIGYGRRTTVRIIESDGQVQMVPNAALDALGADGIKQTTPLLVYTEHRVTNAVASNDTHRTPLPSESITFELTGYTATGAAGRFRASDLVEPDGATSGRLRHRFADEVDYATLPTGNRCRRPIEWLRAQYRHDDLHDLLPLGQLESLALPGERYKLAFTSVLLEHVFQRPRGALPPEVLVPDPAAVLGGPGGDRGGYVRRGATTADGQQTAGDHWWLPSGRSYFTTNPATPPAELAEARSHFFVPRRYRDPFDHDTLVDFDTDDLLVLETRDALDNRMTVVANDYRVLQPRLVGDPNGNRTEVDFDTLGLVVVGAVMGKPAPAPPEGDSLSGSITDPSQAQLDAFFAQPRHAGPTPATSEATSIAQSLLGAASTRVLYDIDRFSRTRKAHPDDPTKWEPVVAATIARETHVGDLPPGEQSRLQISFNYSDGFGREIQRKLQAEPGPIADRGPIANPRWIGSGWTIFNNKGKPVRQYEPFFSSTHHFEFGVQVGVSPVLFYDPAERLITTLHSNHAYEKVVFDPWQQTSYDLNDTCVARNRQTGDPRTDPDVRGYVKRYFDAQPPGWTTWREQHAAFGGDEAIAAERAAAHADTPSTAHLDSHGRAFLTISPNRVVCPGHDLNGTEEAFATRVELDIGGNQREIRDQRRQLVANLPTGALEQRVIMRYEYDLLGHRIYQHSMEAGARWMLADVAGRSIRTWDARGHEIRTSYDVLRRPVTQRVLGTTADSDARTLNPPAAGGLLTDLIEYGEPPVGASQATQDRARRLNLRTRVARHFDSAGLLTNASLSANGDPTSAYDFKGNLLYSTRRLTTRYDKIPDWSRTPAPPLDAERFETATRYDALNRPVQSIAPHSNIARGNPPHPRFNVIQPVFNDAGLLERVDVWLERPAEPQALLDRANEAPSPAGVADIGYNAKGQRTVIDYKTRDTTVVRSTYTYDDETFRLTRLYTRRGVDPTTAQSVGFTGDCENPEPPPPATIAAPENPPPGKGCGLQNLNYTYDAVGNVTHIHDDAQQTIYFRNQRSEPSNDYTYDALYRLLEARGREHLGQQATGARKPPTAPDAVNTFHSGRDQPNDEKAMGTYVERYTYDEVGNCLQMHHRGTDPAHPGWTRAYDYLETSTIEDGRAATVLRMSNRLSRTTLSPTAATPQPERYRHDAHGNMTRMPHLGVAAGGPNLFWDYKDRLCRANLGGGGTAHYVYAASGERVRKVCEKAAGLVEERIYLGGFELFRTRPGPIAANAATFERETLHLNDDQQRIALVETRTLDTAGTDRGPPRLIRYQLSNHLGSSSLELDDAADIISYEEYAPYGATTYQAVRSRTETPKRYRYAGKERDDESGFGHHRSRSYADWLGRWLSPDRAGLADALNMYLACRANPIHFVDPHGTQSAATPGSNEQLNQSQEPPEKDSVGGYAQSTSSPAPLDPGPVKSPVAGYTGGPHDSGVIGPKGRPEGARASFPGRVTFDDAEAEQFVKTEIGERSAHDLKESLDTAADIRTSESDPTLREHAWQQEHEITREFARRSQSSGNKILAIALIAPPAIAVARQAIVTTPAPTLIKTIAANTGLRAGTLTAGQTAWTNVYHGVDRPLSIVTSFAVGWSGARIGSALQGSGGIFQWMPVTGLTPRYAFYQTLLNLRTFALSQVAWYWYGKWASAVNSFGKGTTIAAETTASYYNQIGTGSRSLFWNIFFSTPIGRKLFPEMFDDPTYNVINSQLLGNAQAFGVQAITDTSPR